MVSENKIREISIETTRFLLKKLDDEKIEGNIQDVSSLAASIASTIIFNLANIAVKAIDLDGNGRKPFYALIMWSVNKTIYDSLDHLGIKDGGFSMECITESRSE